MLEELSVPHDLLQEHIARDLFSDTMTAHASAQVLIRPSGRHGGGRGEWGGMGGKWGIRGLQSNRGPTVHGQVD